MLILSVFILLASLIQLLFGLAKVLQSGPLIDFAAFYTNTQLFLTGGNPYAPPHSFNYPPAILLFFSPLAIFPQLISQIIFTLISLVALFVSCIIILRLFNKSWPPFFFLSAVILQSFPVKFTLSMGQVNLFVLMFAVFSFYFDQKNRPKFAGIFWALSSILKITPLTLGLYFLVRKSYKTLIWGAIIFFLSNFLLVYFQGWTSSYFLTAVPEFFLTLNNSSSLYDQSLKAFFIRLGLSNSSLILSVIISGLLMLLTIRQYLSQASFLRPPAGEAGKQESSFLKKWIPHQVRDDKLLLNLTFFSLILAITTIGNSYAWQHHFVFLIPGYIVAIANFLNSWKRQRHLGGGRLIPMVIGISQDSSEVKELKKRRYDINILLLRSFFLLLSFLLFSYHFLDPIHPPTTNPILISHTLIGAITLIGLLLTHRCTEYKTN